MTKKNNLIDKIKSVSIKNKSKWEEKIKFRLKNKKWLDYSAQIAMRIDAIIEGKIDFNQISLAETLKVSPQQISKILKGEQNLTLQTIGNLSDALGIELISFPAYKDSFINLMNYEEGSYSINGTDMQYVQLNKEFNNLTESLTEEIQQRSEAIVITMNGKDFNRIAG